MNGVVVKTPAKSRLIDFIQNGKMDEDYNFTIEGDAIKAEAFVQQMRVELSRFRNIVKSQGREPRNFKVLLIGVDEYPNEQDVLYSKITLRQSMAGHVRIEEKFGDVLSKLSKPDAGIA